MVRIRVPVIYSANSRFKDLDEEPKKTINRQQHCDTTLWTIGVPFGTLFVPPPPPHTSLGNGVN